MERYKRLNFENRFKRRPLITHFQFQVETIKMETESSVEIKSPSRKEQLSEKSSIDPSNKTTGSVQSQAQNQFNLQVNALKNIPLASNSGTFNTDDFLSRVNMNDKINNILRSPTKAPNGIRQRSVFTAITPTTVSSSIITYYSSH